MLVFTNIAIKHGKFQYHIRFQLTFTVSRGIRMSARDDRSLKLSDKLTTSEKIERGGTITYLANKYGEAKPTMYKI